MEYDMETKETKTKENGCCKKCCSLTRCQCAFLIVIILGLIAAVIALSVLLAQERKSSDEIPTTGSPQQSPWDNHRLPDYIIPDHYDLTLYPDFYDGHETFYGNVTIRLNITKVTKYLLIHIRDLTVKQTKLRRAGNEITVQNIFHYKENEYWVVEAEDPIELGQVELDLEFEGSLTNGIVGLYKSVYVDSVTNQTKYLASSKFQPTNARKAFPCLDEPGFKSTFTTTLVHRTDFHALSNMPQESNSTRSDGLRQTHFQKSVPMVTYLKCFIVSQFAFKEKTTANGTPFRVYATQDKLNQVDYSLDIGVRILDHYGELYGLNYPLPKLDMIAIPVLVSGATEHWGLITYRETTLLYDETEASPANKQSVAVIVAHELAHMWFGNLVTMQWWDDLWLNEGFASYVEYLGVDHVHPDWDMKDIFVSSELQGIMPRDSTIRSHPIVVPIYYSRGTSTVFDSISYSKGASVIRMLESFMGVDKFRQGLQAYMQKYQYKTTVTDDLWAELEKVEGVPPIKTIMDTWTRQMGFPVITMKIEGSNIKLTQERFLSDPNADKTQPPSPYLYKWHIPITYQTATQNQSDTYWMTSTEFTLSSPVDVNQDWIKLNIRQHGYYRVNYPTEMWQKLADLLQTNHEVLTPSDRSGLIDDIFSLANANLIDLGLVLDMISYMNKEQHKVPWDTVNSKLGYIKDYNRQCSRIFRYTCITNKMIRGVHFEKWQTFVRRLASPVLQRLGYQDTGTHSERQMRSVVIDLACGYGDTECIGNMAEIFRNRLAGQSISPNIRCDVYQYGMAELGQEEAWDYMWNEYNITNVPQEKERLLYAVTQTRVPWLIQRLLTYSKDPSKVRDQDFFTLITDLGRNPVAHPLVWSWSQENWPALVDRFGIDNRPLGRMVPGLVTNFNSEAQLNTILEFFDKYPDAGAGERDRARSLEKIRANIAWLAKNQDTIVTWLDANVE